MSKISQDLLLQRAESEFLQGNYAKALRSYGLILRDYPTLDEAKIGVYLSDLGIESLDTSKHKLQELLVEPIEEQIEYGDGIRYSDFQKLVKSRGSFKKTFEDIMFSTKV